MWAGADPRTCRRCAARNAHRVAQGIVETKTKIIDLDLRAYFDNVQHSLLLVKVAKRVRDDRVMRLLKMILKATGKKGVSAQSALCLVEPSLSTGRPPQS
jgi:hypothetical protein